MAIQDQPGLIARVFSIRGCSSVYRQGGFTLVELIVLMIVMGILSAVVLPRWNGETGFEGRGFHDELVAALRYAQKSAVAARRTVCVDFSSMPVVFRIADTQAAANCLSGQALAGASGAALLVSPSGNASLAAAPNSIVFDSAGRPLAGAAVISISGLPSTLAITVESETGYVH